MEPLAPARHIAGARHRTSPPALRARPSNDARLAEGGLELAHLDLPTHEDPARKGIQDVVLPLYGGGCTDCRRRKVDGLQGRQDVRGALWALIQILGKQISIKASSACGGMENTLNRLLFITVSIQNPLSREEKWVQERPLRESRRPLPRALIGPDLSPHLLRSLSVPRSPSRRAR